MKVFNWRIVTLLVLVGFLMTACSSGTTKEEQNDGPKPITLKFLLNDVLEEEQFNEQYKDPIEEQFSHITIERMIAHDLPEMIAGGQTPDLYFVDNPTNLKDFIESELVMDLSELVEKHGFDLSRIEPNILEEHHIFSNGDLYTIPLSLGMTALHYNKEVFDLFGVEYPTDDMTWEEIISLAEKVTGERDGVQYHGLQPAYPSILYDQRGMVFVNPETDESAIMDDGKYEEFAKVLQTIEQMANIPGNIPTEDSDAFLYGWGEEFISDRNIAMLPLWQLIEWYSSDESFEFDIVTYPEWEDFPGITRPSKAFSLGITSTSKHPDEAFKVIDYLLSDEKQIEWAKGSQASALRDPAINQHLFEELIKERPYLEDVNLEALTKQSPAPGSEQYSEYEHVATGVFEEMVRGIIEENKDVNTVLREGHEKLTTLLEDAKTQK